MTARTLQFAVSNWKSLQKNTLRGFLTITTPSGMVIHGCSLHDQDGSRWISLPSQKFTKDDGSTGYAPVVEFTTRDARDRFNAAALYAVDLFLRGE